MLIRSIAVLAAVLAAAAASGQSDPLVGTFSDDRLTITLSATSKGYGGTIALAGAKTFSFTAAAKDGGLDGQFSDAAGAFPFTARLDGEDTLVLRTGETTYRLARHNPITRRMASMPPPDARDVDAAIRRAKEYLYAAQADGHWDPPQRLPMPKGGVIRPEDHQKSSQWGGLSAFVTYTLLTAGDNPADPRLAAAVKFLKKAEIDGTYALACRLLAWSAMPTSARKQVIELALRDRDRLLKNKRGTGTAKGLFRYLADDVGADHSASQFAVLGLWAADQLGAEVPTTVWREMEGAWLAGQQGHGGWPYTSSFSAPTKVTPSMTAAGVATLFITGDALQWGRPAPDCRGNVLNKAIDAGIAWINARADDFFRTRGDFPFYTLYGVERIGLASGMKYVGSIDWYKQGAYALLDAQHPDGSWGANVPDTCFGILFLARGRAPVALNKLQYAIDTRGDTPKPAHWNQRPRDAANAARWLSRQLEREVQWQIVNLSGPVEDLHDAPILYIAGNQQLVLSPADEEKLRQFVRQGGLILGNADCANASFSSSFRRLGGRLFPPYEFRELPADHVVFGNLYARSRWKNPPQVQGLSNGARELMILLPAADPARFWQTSAAAGNEAAFELLANLFLYCSDRRDLRLRGESWLVRPRPNATTTKAVKIARLRHEYNADPEPGGWPRLATILRNEHEVDLTTEMIPLGQGKLDASVYKLAHVTTTGPLKFKDAERAELKAYLEAGGTLLADAAGGSAEGAAALEAEIALLSGKRPEMLPEDHAVYADLGVPPKSIAYRPYAAKRSLGGLTGPRLRGAAVGNRTAIVYSPEDLSVGLVGQSVDGIYGYAPESATALVKSIVLHAAGGR